MNEQGGDHTNYAWYSKERGPVLGEEKNAFLLLKSLIERGRESQTADERLNYQGLLSNLLRAGSLTKAQILEVTNANAITPEQVQDSNGSLSLGKIVNTLIPTESMSPMTTKDEGETEKPKEVYEEEAVATEPRIVEIDEVILPTPLDAKPIEYGPGPQEEKPTFRRYHILLELLESQGIPGRNYYVIKGKLKKGTLRKKGATHRGDPLEGGYGMFVIPALNKMVLVCNQMDNATFLVHYSTEHPELFYRLPKEILKLLPMVTEIDWPNDEEKWKDEILDTLTLPDSDEQFEESLREAEAELRENKNRKKITLEDLTTNRALLENIVGQTKDWVDADRTTKLVPLPGYEIITTKSFVKRLGRELGLTTEQTKNYLNLLLADPEKAKGYPAEAIKQRQEDLAEIRTIIDFLMALDAEDLKSKDYNELYAIFCAQQNILPNNSLKERFESRLSAVRRRRDLKIKENLPKQILNSMRNFVATLSADDLTKKPAREILERFLLTEPIITVEQKNKALTALKRELHKEREKRGLESELTDRPTPEVALARTYIAGLSDDELRKSRVTSVYYPKFLATHNLTPEKLSFHSFGMKVAEARNARSVVSEKTLKERK